MATLAAVTASLITSTGALTTIGPGLATLSAAGSSAAGIGTALAIDATLFGALESAQGARVQASQARAQAAQIGLQTAVAERDRARRTREILASQTVAFAAAGVEPGTGSPAELAAKAQREAARQTRIERGQALTATSLLDVRERSFRRQGSLSLIGGGIRAGTIGLNLQRARSLIG